jgi:hypothetical protein
MKSGQLTGQSGPENVCAPERLGAKMTPSGLRDHSRDSLAALVTDRAMQACYHPSIA